MNYSAIDRILHRVAFGAPSIQLTARDIESKLFSAVYDGVAAARPIFVTSLPRAGTTVMLEALSRLPSLATHTYRDMPFLMSPVLWSRLSGAFRLQAAPSERAHGDGLEIGYDSPEAFEEVLWQAFWPENYGAARIALWRADEDRENAGAFFREHMKKIIALRRPGRETDARYLSKNNANIARIELICRMFPDAGIVVPFREPVAHADSLLRQHRNFLEMHAQDPFSRRYMADLGHFEFGRLHRPIAFPGLERLLQDRDPLRLDYWLAYWIAAFEHLKGLRDRILLVPYEAMCGDAARLLPALCTRLGIPDDGICAQAAALFKAPPSRTIDRAGLDPALLRRAGALHAALNENPL